MRWPERTQVAFCIAGFLAIVVIPPLLGVTENEEDAFVIGAAAMYWGHWWFKRQRDKRESERRVWEQVRRHREEQEE